MAELDARRRSHSVPPSSQAAFSTSCILPPFPSEEMESQLRVHARFFGVTGSASGLVLGRPCDVTGSPRRLPPVGFRSWIDRDAFGLTSGIKGDFQPVRKEPTPFRSDRGTLSEISIEMAMGGQRYRFANRGKNTGGCEGPRGTRSTKRSCGRS